MYDIFYIHSNTLDKASWEKIKNRYPTAQRLENISSFNQARDRSFTKMFWVIWDDLNLADEFDLTAYRATEWDDKYVHVFKNGSYYDGICLFPKSLKILPKEWDYRFFSYKKEIDIIASTPTKFDIVFISYDEPFADENYQNLSSIIAGNKLFRVQKVKGIHQAHIEAAKLASTDMFYVVDADAKIMPNFKFDYQIPYYDVNAKKTVHVWRSQNPVNGLIYGYGGIKLLPTKLTIDMDVTKPDMTTSISNSFKAIHEVSNITAFNTDPYNSWKSAFRECVKLSSKVIDRQKDNETANRLEIWCTKTTDPYALDGAIKGRDYGIRHKNNLEELKKINDFAWLKEQFDARHG